MQELRQILNLVEQKTIITENRIWTNIEQTLSELEPNFTNPFVKIFISQVIFFRKTYGDYGKYIVLLALRLLEKQQDMPFYISSYWNQQALKIMVENFSRFREKIDIMDPPILLKWLKTHLNLKFEDLRNSELIPLILQWYVATFDSDLFEYRNKIRLIQTQDFEGQFLTKLNGLLLDTKRHLPEQLYRTFAFHDNFDAFFHLDPQSAQPCAINDTLAPFVSIMKERDANLLAWQKVVPPAICKALKLHGIYVLDKISGTWIQIFERATKKQDNVMVTRYKSWTFVQSPDAITVLINTIHKHVYEAVVAAFEAGFKVLGRLFTTREVFSPTVEISLASLPIHETVAEVMRTLPTRKVECAAIKQVAIEAGFELAQILSRAVME